MQAGRVLTATAIKPFVSLRGFFKNKDIPSSMNLASNSPIFTCNKFRYLGLLSYL
jgi:hypothetical protein